MVSTYNRSVCVLLIVRSVSALVWVMRSLWWRWALHTWGRGAPGSDPHAGTEAPRLGKRWAESALVFSKLLHGTWVVVVRRRGIDRRGWATVLGRRPWWWVVHVWGHLTQDVSWRRSNGRGSIGYRRGRGLVVNHVWSAGALRVLHRVSDRWGRRGWTKVLLW